MSLIEKLGGIGVAEMIASCLLTTAKYPQYFCLKPKQYFNLVNGMVFFYDDDEQQFFEYKLLAECDFDYVSIKDLREAIQQQLQTDLNNCSQKDSSSKSIENHCSHGYDVACLLCGFGNEGGKRVWRGKHE